MNPHRQKPVAIIDHGFSNIGSIGNVLSLLRIPFVIVRAGDYPINNIGGFILPGVGSFGPAMKSMRQRGLDITVKDCVRNNIKGIGICLGMHMFAQASYEDDCFERGLGFFPGTVQRLDNSNDFVPNVCWLTTKPTSNTPQNLSYLLDGTFYYVHSYAYDIQDVNSISATCRHGDADIAAAIYSPSLLGLQFHPEKSQVFGLRLLHEFFKNPSSEQQ